MNKLIAVVASLFLVMALAGCATSAAAANDAAAPAATTAPAATAAPAADAAPAAAAPAAAAVPAGEVIVLDSFEDGQFWELDTSVKDGLLAEISTEKGVVDGSSSLAFMFKACNWAVVKTNMLEVNDWTGARYFVFDVLNDSDKPVDMGMCLMDGDNWEWQQTPSITIQPGKQTFVAGLTDGTFTSTKGGVHSVPAPNGAANVAFCAIVVHKSEQDTTVYIDNVRLIK